MPPEPTVTRSAFADALLRLRYEIARRLAWDESRVIITAGEPESVPHLGAGQDVILRSRTEWPQEAAIEGGGRAVNLRRRSLEIVMRSRLAIDQVAQSVAQLTEDSLGHLRLEDAVCDAVEVFQADDPELSAYGLPFRCGELTMPRPDKGDPSWVSSSWTVELLYERALDQDVARQ